MMGGYPPGAARLDQGLQYLKGVGPARAQALQRLGLVTIAQLLEHYPRHHDDRTVLRPLSELQLGCRQTFSGCVVSVNELMPRPGMHLVKVGISDGTGLVVGIWWNQPYIKRAFTRGAQVVMTGRVENRFGELQVDSPEFEFPDRAASLSTGRLVPIYPLGAGLTQPMFRKIAHAALQGYGQAVPEGLPATVRDRLGLIEAGQALRDMHFPPNLDALERARRRLAFEELFVLQVALSQFRRMHRVMRPGISHGPNGEAVCKVLAGLPFQLTGAQQRVTGEIWADMAGPLPMNRLVQGDVGSGKTVVAALAMAKAVDSARQAALMAPTELLAEQHYANLRSYLEPAGIRVALLTGSTGRRRRRELAKQLAGNGLEVVVGTHALIQEPVGFSRLSLAVTDEQHRFGVRQRLALQQKGPCPDVLVMTATPIPRTLALTIYGDLDISSIDELPPGRRPVKTFWRTQDRRMLVYRFLREQVEAGGQAYVVCPLVSESPKLEDLAATELARELSGGPLRGLQVGLLHGRLPSKTKNATMQAFREGQLQVLVCTTVIEVGVDVPNANVLVVEGADRFGLSQLHQLRGRVGRGRQQSYCILLAEPRTEPARQRMDVMVGVSDGFRLAEEDLRLRGPGEFFGIRQHGVPEFKVADLSRDLGMAELARAEAAGLLAADPMLARPEHAALHAAVLSRFGEKFGLMFSG
ncbi:MAG TPA: DNA helicase RecG [Clostridiales bacterium UBA8153]|nr:DNA helicase RecG [Clostridiales bacterium UBA8153]